MNRNASIQKREKRERRHRKVRAKIYGTKSAPRLSVFRSNRYIYAQLIDDTNGATIVAASDSSGTVTGKNKTDRAHNVGYTLAKDAKAKKITRVAFDRGGFLYAGRIKALAEGAREGGLRF